MTGHHSSFSVAFAMVCSVTICVGPVACRHSLSPTVPPASKSSLEGDWVMTSLKAAGKELGPKPIMLHFRDDVMVASSRVMQDVFKVRFNETTVPHTFDTKWLLGNHPESGRLFIFKREGDELIIRAYENDTESRPADFDAQDPKPWIEQRFRKDK